MLTYSGYSEEGQPAADTQREYQEAFLAREERKILTQVWSLSVPSWPNISGHRSDIYRKAMHEKDADIGHFQQRVNVCIHVHE